MIKDYTNKKMLIKKCNQNLNRPTLAHFSQKELFETVQGKDMHKDTTEMPVDKR